jgi:hypothetical protein
VKKHFFRGLLLVAATTLMISCGKVPQAEIDQANKAIEAAQAAGADLYVPDAFAAVQDSLKSVMESIESQKSKLFRNYSNDKEALAAVTTMATDVKAKSEARQEELKAEIQTTMTSVQALIDEDRQLLTKAPRGKEGTAALTAIKNDITVIEGSVAEAKTMFEGGDLLGTMDKLNAAQEKASSINAELKEVIAKYNKARGIK